MSDLPIKDVPIVKTQQHCPNCETNAREAERWRVRADQYNDECERMGIKGQAIIDQLSAENEALRHDLERQMSIANEHVNEVNTLLREIETLRVDAVAERFHGYYVGFAKADEQNATLREALEAAPLIGRTESVYDFMERQEVWLKGPYRAALQEQSK